MSLSRANAEGVSFAVRFLASLALPVWGLLTVLLGIFNGLFLWIAIGLVLTVAGLPLLGSHPWAASRLYPASGNIEGAASPEPAPPPSA